MLAAEGLVTMKVRRGAYVTEVSQQDLAAAYHLRSLLESDAAGVVATKATDGEINELQALHKALEIANNRWRDQMVAEHRAIMDALATRDPALTAQRMAEHFANGLEAAT